MPELRISDSLSLPIEAVTQTFAFLAKRGVGKTYNSGVMVEEMLSAGAQVCVVDPVGVMWGLRLDKDGNPGGYQIIVFGGDHGDLPLHADQGEAIALFLIESKRSIILDLSHFRKYEMRRFMIAFAETVYRLNRDPLHIVLDEADAFAPQRTSGGGRGEDKEESEGRLLGAIEDLVRRGRARGIGITMITQRPAVLNKNILTQIEVLVCLRLVAPQDVKAIGEWVEQHGTIEQYKELTASLPSLPIGEAWLWSPGWLDCFTRIRFRQKRTFDSSKTPKVGEILIAPKDLTPVDIDLLRDQFAVALQEKAENDPKILKSRIKELEARKESTSNADIMRSRIEEATAPLIQRIDTLETFIAEGAKEAENLSILASNHRARFTFGDALIEESYKAEKAETVKSGDIYTTETAKVASAVASQSTIAPPPVERPVSDRTQTKHQRMIRTLAEMRSVGAVKVDRKVLAGLTGQSHKSSAYDQALRELRGQGLIESGPAGLSLTKDGIALAGKVGKPPSLAELHKTWRSFLSRSAVRCLEVVIRLHPKSVERLDIAKLAGISPTSSSFDAALRELRGWGLISGSKVVDGTALLFPEGLK